MLNNIHPNIYYKFNVFQKQNSTRIATEEEEEEEEAGCSRNHTTKKRLQMYHHLSLIKCP
jgi:hypothetical protein